MGQDGGSISTTWPSVCAICRQEFAARRSIAARTAAYADSRSCLARW
jgi:hypothetical protein